MPVPFRLSLKSNREQQFFIRRIRKNGIRQAAFRRIRQRPNLFHVLEYHVVVEYSRIRHLRHLLRLRQIFFQPLLGVTDLLIGIGEPCEQFLLSAAGKICQDFPFLSNGVRYGIRIGHQTGKEFLAHHAL